MNKLFIVLLAVCLVSVHAFVKRDAEEASNAATGADIQKQVQDIINTIGAKISESLSPEQLKKNFNNVVDEVQKSCHGLPASVSEAHSSASQKLHLYIKNSTEGVNYQLSPIISQLRNTNEEVEFGRNAILPFLSFLFDTLGDIENELSDCLDDMVIQLIPDDPSDPGFPNIPTEPSVPIGPIVPADIAASENKPK